MKLNSLLLSTVLLCVVQSASAAIYTYTDASGAPVFTDTPPKQQAVETLDFGPTHQVPSTVSAPVIHPPPVYHQAAEPLPIVYQSLRILTPEPDATIRANDRQFIITVNSEPSLLKAHYYRFLVDGKAVSPPTRSPVLRITEVDRGTHLLAVEIINAEGAVLERTPAQPFHLQQSTLNDRRLTDPCASAAATLGPECEK